MYGCRESFLYVLFAVFVLFSSFLFFFCSACLISLIRLIRFIRSTLHPLSLLSFLSFLPIRPLFSLFFFPFRFSFVSSISAYFITFRSAAKLSLRISTRFNAFFWLHGIYRPKKAGALLSNNLFSKIA